MRAWSRMALTALVCSGCAHRTGELALQDPRLNGFVHNLSRHRVAAGDRTVWYYVAGTTGAPAGGSQLLVLLDGSRLTSVLGEERGGDLRSPGLVYTVLRHGRPRVDVLAVESTFFIEPFANHTADRRVLEHYTLEDRVLAAALAIADHLAAHRYDRVVLLGYSEGATLAGRVYRALKSRALVAQVALGGNGGRSQQDQFRIQRSSKLPLPPAYRARLDELDEVAREIRRAPDAVDRWWLGWPFKRWSSFLFYEPRDDLKAIEVPVLCVHGAEDTHSPVESSRFLAEELARAGKGNVVYKEYPGLGHALSDAAWAELLDLLFPGPGAAARTPSTAATSVAAPPP